MVDTRSLACGPDVEKSSPVLATQQLSPRLSSKVTYVSVKVHDHLPRQRLRPKDAFILNAQTLSPKP